MTIPKIATWQGCPIRFFAGQLGDKWSLLILRDMMFKGKSSYGEFLAAGEGIATNILATRLRKLEAAGIIARDTADGKAARPAYGLTAKGRDLMPVMLAIIQWSATHDDATEVPAAFAKALRCDPKTVQAGLEATLRT